jgi:hypothetical protein
MFATVSPTLCEMHAFYVYVLIFTWGVAMYHQTIVTDNLMMCYISHGMLYNDASGDVVNCSHDFKCCCERFLLLSSAATIV